MTITQMHISWRERYDRSGNLNSMDFDSEQIDYWLNLAQEAFVKNRYLPINKGFEQNEKRISDLEEIVVAEVLPVVDQGVGGFRPNSYMADLSGLSYTHWFTLNEEVTYSYMNCNNVLVRNTRNGVTQCTEDLYPALVESSFSDHNLHGDYARPLRLRRRNLVEFITDGNYAINNYYIVYLRKPTPMNYSTSTNCELKDHTHEEIIEMAVRMAAASITDKELYQMQLAENKLQGQ